MKQQCKFCGTVTGQHGFAFGKDGKYSTPKEETWAEFEAIRRNDLRELLKKINMKRIEVREATS